MDESVWNENTLDQEQKRKGSKCEITTHVSIHTIHLDGLRELYRQFLRLPDGAVIEVIQGSRNGNGDWGWRLGRVHDNFEIFSVSVSSKFYSAASL